MGTSSAIREGRSASRLVLVFSLKIDGNFLCVLQSVELGTDQSAAIFFNYFVVQVILLCLCLHLHLHLRPAKFNRLTDRTPLIGICLLAKVRRHHRSFMF